MTTTDGSRILSLSAEARAKRQAALDEKERQKEAARKQAIAAFEQDRRRRPSRDRVSQSEVGKENDDGQRWSPEARNRQIAKADVSTFADPTLAKELEAQLNSHFRERSTHNGFNTRKPRTRKR